jgi:tetrahydrodipicolinate N-succinyltransferase
MNRLTKYFLTLLAGFAFLVVSVRAADDVATAIHGVITKADSASRTIVVKTKEGTEHTFHFVDKTVVHGTEAGAKDSFKGLKEGSEVAVHYTVKGSEKTASEVDNIGKDGIKAVDGTVEKVGDDGKTVTVKTADGTDHVFTVAGRDTASAAKDLGKGTEKAGHVTVYYTEEGGKKVAHFFQKL